MHADLVSLRLLDAVAATGSLTAAAARTGMTQQAASQRIRALETRTGVRLLQRGPAGSRLTAAGELVHGWSRDLLAAADRLDAGLATLSAGGGAALTVAASLTIAEHLAPAWLTRWRDRHPDAPAPRLRVANSTAVVDDVRHGRADLGYIETPDLPEGLGSVRIGVDAVRVIVAPTHPWAGRGAATLDELVGTPLIQREPGSGTRRAFERGLEAAGRRMLVGEAAVMTSTHAILAMAEGGAAPAVLGGLAVAAPVAAGRLVEVRVAGLEATRPLTAIWSGRAPGGAASELLELVWGGGGRGSTGWRGRVV